MIGDVGFCVGSLYFCECGGVTSILCVCGGTGSGTCIVERSISVVDEPRPVDLGMECV